MIKTPCCGKKWCCFAFFTISFVCFFFGLALCFAYLPERIPKDGLLENVLHVHLGRPIKEKIMDLIPDKPVEPHWTPISISASTLTMCQLDFKTYNAQPYSYPMFKDLVSLSRCDAPGNTRTSSVSAELEDIRVAAAAGGRAGRVVYPSGFVFHESRVGSTLIANMLASDLDNMVFSESSVGSSLFRRQSPELFRDVLTVMGRSPTHKRMFFKFQSKTTLNMEIALQAFPDVPWIFIYRKPVEVMMSHLAPHLGSSMIKLSPPCLRLKSSAASRKQLAPHLSAGEEPPAEAWCAAYLADICQTAIAMHAKYGMHRIAGVNTTGKEVALPRGFIVDYASLPGIFPRKLMSFLGLSVTSDRFQKILAASSQYSKGRSWYNPKAGRFSTDSKDKIARATKDVVVWSGLLLEASYRVLSGLAEKSYSSLDSHDEGELPLHRVTLPVSTSLDQDWAGVRAMPSEPVPGTLSRQLFTDESTFDSKLYNPFSSFFNSSYYETVSCPLIPEPDYPRSYPLIDLLANWNPDDTTIPPMHYDSLCRFDYATQLPHIESYRRANVPVIITGLPEVTEAVKRWSDLDYLNNKLGPYVPYATETSRSNHFMFARGKSYEDHMKLLLNGPTGMTLNTFEEWLREAVIEHNHTLKQRTHKYFRVTATVPTRHWLYEEFPFFKPDSKFFHSASTGAGKGINCRFGMKGIIAECHYDGTPNFAAGVGGLRRWILAHPSQCESLHLLQKDSTSSRHSAVDWSSPDHSRFPRFKHAQANEIILAPGDVLFVPGYWFHFIVSLNVNFQCNCRAGQSGWQFRKIIHQCGNF